MQVKLPSPEVVSVIYCFCEFHIALVYFPTGFQPWPHFDVILVSNKTILPSWFMDGDLAMQSVKSVWLRIFDSSILRFFEMKCCGKPRNEQVRLIFPKTNNIELRCTNLSRLDQNWTNLAILKMCFCTFWIDGTKCKKKQNKTTNKQTDKQTNTQI